ncbi:hypothetical protein K491DRAFT_720538 [Lophiostoma macrostomum CBS 122681]|uniref:Uncharacterized protein n=1 Tax=Lophiostoma macrostomum CBS 122681 TaxID=1314788 RepID=A0A6A6SSB8_9PLEO|nr:hypothetical protein K491DRAFT_720538 [Lophiostoma macrostomum CBS 122681]
MASTGVSRKRPSPNDTPALSPPTHREHTSTTPSRAATVEDEHSDDSPPPPALAKDAPPFKNVQLPGEKSSLDVQSKPMVVDLDDDDNKDPDLESTEEDKQEHQKLLNEGAQGLAEQRSTSIELPDEVRKLHRELAPLVRQWWKAGAVPKSHENSFKKTNERIEKTCHGLAKKEFDQAVKEELVKQVKAGKINAKDERLKKEFVLDFWVAGSETHEKKRVLDLNGKDKNCEPSILSQLHKEWKKKQSFFYFEEPAQQGRAVPQPWVLRWKTYAEKFQFPQSQIEGQIISLGLAVKNIEKLKEDIDNLQVKDVTSEVGEKKVKNKSHEELQKELSRARKSVIEGALVFTELLNSRQLELKLIIPDRYKVLFAELVNESEETKKTHKEFLATLTNPLKEQEEIWAAARPELQQFFEQAIVPEGDLSKMRQILEWTTQQNKQLVSVNKEVGIVPYNYEFPVSDMQALCRFKEKSANDDVQKRLQKIKALMGVWWKEEDLATVFPSQVGDVRLADEKLLEQQRKLLQITQGDESPSSSSSSSPSAAPSPSNQTNAKPQQASQSSGGLFVSEDSTASADPEYVYMSDFSAFNLDDDTITMMQYDDGRTEHGKLEATRPCRTGNVRFSRFIVNAGTEKAPFYKVIKGADLGPGGAETFHEEGWQHLYTRFDLTARKQAMKTVGGCTIKALGPCVEMPRESSTRLTKSGKPYRQDLYVKVEYHKDEAKNPHAESLPTVEWLTRTELGQLVGKKYAEAQEKIMMEKYKRRQWYFDECKMRELHPETKKPLSTSDFEQYPWLFPDDASVPKGTEINAGVEVDSEGDHDMAGVNADGAKEGDKTEL